MGECPGCNAKVELGDVFCRGCGEELPQEETYMCDCGAEVKFDDNYCHQCGASFNEDMKACTCGAEIGPNANFCPSCGSPVAREDNIQEAEVVEEHFDFAPIDNTLQKDDEHKPQYRQNPDGSCTFVR